MIQNFVDELLAPVYSAMGASAPLIIGLVILFIFSYFFNKLRMVIKSRKTHKFKTGTTNTWFSWDEYNVYCSNVKTDKKGK